MLKQEIGQKIKEIREKKKLSQEDLAKLSHLDRTYLCRVENGKQNLTIETLEVICHSLDISVYTLFKNFEGEENNGK